MNKLCASLGSIVSKPGILGAARIHPQPRTPDPQDSRSEKSVQGMDREAKIDLSRVRRCFIYYYYI
jgi:hypothetical protein